MLLSKIRASLYIKVQTIFNMNNKRNLPQSDEIVAKKAKFMDDLSSDEISMSEKGLVGPEWRTKHKDREAQSHGEHTFRANNHINGDTDSALNDLHIDCFDGFDSADDQKRQPVAGNIGQAAKIVSGSPKTEKNTDICLFL